MRKHILKKKKTLKSLSIFRACRRINDTHETKTGFYKKEQSESKKEFSEMVYCVYINYLLNSKGQNSLKNYVKKISQELE